MILTKLPIDILIHTVQYLDIKEKQKLMETCQQLRYLLLRNPICWSHLDCERYHLISDFTLQTVIERYILSNRSIYDNTIVSIKCVVFLNLSGCQRISNRLVTRMLELFTELRVLELNKFNSPEIVIRSRSLESLKNTTAQISFRATYSFSPYIYGFHTWVSTTDFSLQEIGCFLENMNQLTTFIMQRKYIGPNSTMSFINKMKKLTHLDLSFCSIDTHILTFVLKAIIPQLTTLKLSKISLKQSQLNFIKEQGKNLECLHLFCETDMLSIVGDTVSKLEKLVDFKLHTQPGDTIDIVIQNLNCQMIKKLEFATSKRVNHTVTRSIIGGTPAEITGFRRHQRGDPHNQRGYSCISTQGLLNLGHCSHLTELRLCYVILGKENSLANLYQSLNLLEVLELRGYIAKYLLTGIDKLKKLKELHLYSIELCKFSIEYINNTTSLEYLTISDCGLYVEASAIVEFWLTEMTKLNILVLCQLTRPTSLWLNFINLIFQYKKGDYCNVIFTRKPPTKMWYVI